MDYLEKIELIKKKLVAGNRHDLADEILERQLSGGTGGEVLISVCGRLLSIRKEDKSIFELIKEESESLIKYANSIGLFPRPS